jgi:hypothetical protein
MRSSSWRSPSACFRAGTRTRGSFQAAIRRFRQRGGRRSDLPDLEAGRGEYATNVGRIIDAARERGARVVLATQPTLWRDGLGPAEESLLWAGGPPFYAWKDGAAYFDTEALARGMVQFNTTLLEVCAERGAVCIDAAAEIPRTTEFFYDDAHFTEAGSARLARLIADRLLAEEGLVRRDDAMSVR